MIHVLRYIFLMASKWNLPHLNRVLNSLSNYYVIITEIVNYMSPKVEEPTGTQGTIQSFKKIAKHMLDSPTDASFSDAESASL